MTRGFIENVEEEDWEKLYGVWFSKPEDATEGAKGALFDADDEPIAPDLVRVADRVPNFEPIGLLEQISEQDMLETDLYVFRESTGELVVEKTPFVRLDKAGNLKENQINGVDEASGKGYFELTVPGSYGASSVRNTIRNRAQYKAYEDWQASIGIQASIAGYNRDSLRIGEPLTVVAINRATGYLGTMSTSVLDVSQRSITIQIPDMTLYPPNLQVQVQRQYEVEKGLTAGETRNYRVGSEGAALTSDQYVAIHTQWVDHDGTALPSELPGFTGRLVNLNADSTLKADSSVDHFKIEPGKHTELLSLPSAATTAAHQYLHVVGRAMDSTYALPDFSVDGQGEFATRPRMFVPVKVAVYDEEASVELQKMQKTLELSGVKQDSSVYRWVYRPEMQYSVFELDVEQIESVRTDDNGDEQQRDLTEAPTLVIAGNNDALRVKQTLLGSEYNPLTLLLRPNLRSYNVPNY